MLPPETEVVVRMQQQDTAGKREMRQRVAPDAREAAVAGAGAAAVGAGAVAAVDSEVVAVAELADVGIETAAAAAAGIGVAASAEAVAAAGGTEIAAAAAAGIASDDPQELPLRLCLQLVSSVFPFLHWRTPVRLRSWRPSSEPALYPHHARGCHRPWKDRSSSGSDLVDLLLSSCPRVAEQSQSSPSWMLHDNFACTYLLAFETYGFQCGSSYHLHAQT